MMDRISHQELLAMTGHHNHWCVSLYMPAHRAGRDTEQDPIRYKNLLRDAENRLPGKGLRSPDIRALLEPAYNLLQDSEFWRHQSDGLAVFIAPDQFQSFRLPLTFDEMVVISNRFHLKPLLPFLANDGHFYILALSQNQVRLLEGTRHTVDEIELENLPASMAEALQFERAEKQLQFHTGTTAAGTGRRGAMFHGHDPSDEDKTRITRWFQIINAELPALLANEKAPIVLAGVDYLFPLYQKANTYPHIVAEGIPGNPEELTPAELHEHAWSLVEPIFTQDQAEAVARYHEQSSAGQTTTDVTAAVLAAQRGQIDTLFVAVGVQVWGSFDRENAQVSVHPQEDPGDDDLLDMAAIFTMNTGGTVYAVKPEDVPGQGSLAAILRYSYSQSR